MTRDIMIYDLSHAHLILSSAHLISSSAHTTASGDLMQDKYNLNTNPNEGLYDQADINEGVMDDPHGLQMGNSAKP